MILQQTPKYDCVSKILALTAGLLMLIAGPGFSQSITVITPESGQSYATGHPLTITWSDDFSDPSHVGINLLDTADTVVEIITEYTNNTRLYDWPIPSGFTFGDYKVEVYGVVELCMEGNPECGNYIRMEADDQSGVFSIEAPYLAFKPGYDGMQITAGEEFYFDWDHNLSSGQWELHYWKGSFWGWEEITTLPVSATSYLWTTPSEFFSSETEIRIRYSTDNPEDLLQDFIEDLTWVDPPPVFEKMITYQEYDEYGNLLTATDPTGHQVRYYYGSATSPLSQNGLFGVAGVYLTGIEQVNPAGVNLTRTVGYDTDDRLISELADANANKTFFSYDEFQRLVEVQNHNNEVVEDYEYTIGFDGSDYSSANSNRIRTRFYDGTVTRQMMDYFDGLGRPVQSQSLDGAGVVVEALDYDGRGRQWRAWKPYARGGSIGFDDHEAEANSYYSPAGDGPDAAGRPYLETVYTDDPLDRPLRIHPEGVAAASGSQQYSYGVESVDGQLLAFTEVTDEAGKRTRSWTDGWGRTVRTTAGCGTADSATTQFEYDELDRLVKVTSPEGRPTHNRYNAWGQLVARTTPDADGSLDGDPAGETGQGTDVDIEYVYDGADNLRYMRDPNRKAAGEYVEMDYDFAGRLVLERVCQGSLPAEPGAPCSSPGQAISYSWDDDSVGSGEGFTVNNALGNLTKVDFQGGYYLYSYDTDSNIEAMYIQLDGLSGGRQVAYQYNRLGELIGIELGPDEHYWAYDYDPAGRLVQIASGETAANQTDADYTWWPAGMVRAEVLGNQTISFGYDARDRLLDINDVGSSTHRFSARYTYFANGNIDMVEYHQPEAELHQSISDHFRYKFEHTYDGRNQLTGANYQFRDGSSWTNSNEFDVTGLTYDEDGNIQSLSRRFEGLNTYSYSYTSGSNRLASINKNGTNINFGYDPNGNVTTIGGDYNITGTTYDRRNLPTAITKGSTTYGYRYDHEGMRVYKQEGDNIHTLRGAFGEVLAVYKDGSLDYWNILKPDGTVIGRREGSTRLYYHRDHLGSTRAVVNASGSVVQTYDFYPFGLEMPGRSLTSGTAARERFTGHERDEEVGLDYMQARRYAAEFGRFLGVDPLVDEYPGWSPYVYALNNPLRYNDPMGLCPEDPDKEVCVDDTSYRVGAIVENQFGNWQYLGDGQWQTLSLAEGTDNVAGLLETIVKEGPSFLDAAHDAAFQMTVFFGSGLLVASQTPFPHDDLGLAALTSLSAGTAIGADIGATVLSGMDAFMFGGDMNEFKLRALYKKESQGYSSPIDGPERFLTFQGALNNSKFADPIVLVSTSIHLV